VQSSKSHEHRCAASCLAGWFGLGCVFMLVIIYGLLFQARKAAMLRSKKVIF
jgi:bacteriorhodopsin